MITVKKVMVNNEIKSNNCSKINFYWRSLKFLVGKNILEENGTKKQKSFKILIVNKITIEDVYP